MKVKNIKMVKPRQVFAITTTTGTFIADGLAHHNCYRCNITLKGNKLKYYKYMLETYGQGVIDELLILDDIPRKYTVEELKEMRKKYKNMVRNV